MSRSITSRSAATGFTGLVAAIGFALVAAAPNAAQADDYFGAGFEDELGRIAAHAVVGVGVGLFHHAVASHDANYEYAHYRKARHHYKHKRAHRRHYRDHRGHGRHHRYHRRGGHAYRRGIPSCEADSYVTIDRHRRHARRH